MLRLPQCLACGTMAVLLGKHAIFGALACRTSQHKIPQQLQWCCVLFLPLEDAFSWLLAAIK